MTVYLNDPDVTLYHGDVLEVLRQLPDESVDCVVTSPPYWGLRDYGTGEWDGGDPDCDHKPPPKQGRKFTNGRGEGAERRNICIECDYEGPVESEETERCPKCGSKMWDTGYAGSNLTSWTYRDATVKDGGCPKGCGATRVDQQLGLEPTPDLFVQNMVAVFREVRRVLADHGTCWVNLGDSYAANRSYQVSDSKHQAHDFGGSNAQAVPEGLKPKDLVGIPWRVAFALQADGWYLRSDIVWAKPNPMPESVTDRPTKSHEYVFLLTKRPRYWFDAEAVREPHTSTRWGGETITQPPTTKYAEATAEGFNGAAEALSRPGREWNAYPNGGRNVRSVWQIATQPYPEAHFATFPEELARRCIVAGCPTRVCRVCGKPWERPLLATGETNDRDRGNAVDYFPEKGGNPSGIRTLSGATYKRQREAGGMEPTCECATQNDTAPGANGEPSNTSSERPSLGSADVAAAERFSRPGVVLDPFIGSGTVAKVARDHARHAIGIDLNHAYLELAARRLQQLSLLAEA